MMPFQQFCDAKRGRTTNKELSSLLLMLPTSLCFENLKKVICLQYILLYGYKLLDVNYNFNHEYIFVHFEIVGLNKSAFGIMQAMSPTALFYIFKFPWAIRVGLFPERSFVLRRIVQDVYLRHTLYPLILGSIPLTFVSEPRKT